MSDSGCPFIDSDDNFICGSPCVLTIEDRIVLLVEEMRDFNKRLIKVEEQNKSKR